MLIYQGTGVTKTQELRVSKPISSILIRTDRALSEMGNETITVWIEKANGSNVEICTNVPLLDFMLISTFGTSAIFEDAVYPVCGLCELTPEFAIALRENESIKMRLDNLAPTKTYHINGIEEPVTADAVVFFDRKVCLVGETSRKFDVSNYESLCITNHTAISELVLKFDNGQTVRYLQDEFIALSLDTDPVLQVNQSGGGTSLLENRLVFPLFGVEEIEVLKDEATQVVLILKDEKIVA